MSGPTVNDQTDSAPAPISDEVALRVGLASRALPDIDARALLKVLLKLLGEPLTVAKLDRLRPKRLHQAIQNKLNQTSPRMFEEAFSFLRGNGVEKLTCPAPNIPTGVYCDLVGSVRVACASNSGEKIDGNFSSCQRFLIYQVAPSYFRLIDVREPRSDLRGQERNILRAKLLSDCDVLYSSSIGAAAAAKVVKEGLHPIKLNCEAQAGHELEKLQSVLAQKSPPPWLIKAMGVSPQHQESSYR